MRKNLMVPIITACLSTSHCSSQSFSVKNDAVNHTATVSNGNIELTINYDHQCRISAMVVNGEQVLDYNGIYSQVQTKKANLSTKELVHSPVVTVVKNVLEIKNIDYGDKTLPIREAWKFTSDGAEIKLSVARTFQKSFEAESVSFPAIDFKNINTWEGAFQGFGGIAWFYLFNEKLMTYGVHTSQASFWNSKTNNGLRVAVEAGASEVAMKYSRTRDDKLAYSIAVSKNEMVPRFDSGTHRRRFIRNKTNVWAPFEIHAGTTSEAIRFSAFDYEKEYGRGEFKGVNGKQVTSVLNTIARMGVIDANHFGGNSWHTPYGPICLHEQYIAQLGIGINDPEYLEGYKRCLDFYRDNAIRPDGRVWPRWAYTNEDAMPGKYTAKGFYEAQWGYLLDSNPDYVSNVSDLYNQSGDKAWVKTQQIACEKALDYLLARDFNKNYLVEMMTDNHTEKKSSDWIDIIWASYENAFVNAKLFHALRLWSDIESQLGNTTKATYYSRFADSMKISFNKSVYHGGFWDDEKGYYDYWRDKDGSVHGNNLVTPVNFMAIAYGICDDTLRRNSILEKIETEMQKEHLFFWPISMFPYQKDEGKEYQFPFPYYENGDIFLSWGSTAVQAYVLWKPALALQYIKNVLKQHSIDGLAFQRYARKDQSGQGDDILSGNSLAVVGLYQSVYGINPLYNRLYVNPHITSELCGSKLLYNFRGQRLTVALDSNLYSISNRKFSISSDNDFGFFSEGNKVMYFHKNNSQNSLSASVDGATSLSLRIADWNKNEMSWEQSANEKSAVINYKLNQLLPNRFYSIYAGGNFIKKQKANQNGSLSFSQKGTATHLKIVPED